jgi:long-chain acyl-CoA synthetase
MAESLVQIFIEAVERYRKPAQFMRKLAGGWESIPADRALADVESLSLGLRDLGIAPGDRVAILSENRYEWAMADIAILGLGAVSVPIYPTLIAEQCRYILENSEARAVIVSSAAQLDKLHSIADQLPHLEFMIPIDPARARAAKDHPFEAVLARGATLRAANPGAFRESAAKLGPDTLATIIYTSGTTGEPKGAMLNHGNIAFDVDACLKVVALGPDDIQLSFLPLCHIFERMAGLYAMVRAGVTIAFAGSIDSVAADAMEVHPTVLTGVPRFYEKVYARVMENALAQPPLRKNIFFWGLHTGTELARARFERRRPSPWLAFKARIADRLVGAKVRERVGGRVRLCISGGAPLGPKVMEFFFAIGIPVIEGYGLTETSPVICLNVPGREKPGAVGPPIPGVELRIGEDGEVQTRGPHVMRGYYKNEAATRAALLDGWFRTGDVGRLDGDGSLVITDRLKDLLVTAGGKKVAPQPLESQLKTSKWISEAVLLGDKRPYVIALVVPNYSNLESDARTRGFSFSDRDALLALPSSRALIQGEIDRINAGLSSFEQVKRFALLPRDLTQEAGELTPTLKVKRRVISERFAAVIEGLYPAGPAPAGP